MVKLFKGEYDWLSNFAPVTIKIDDIIYPNVESAYVASKTDNRDFKLTCANPDYHPGAIKKMGRRAVIKDDWEETKELVMYDCLKQKYSQDPYKELLLRTEDMHIQEGNYWGDTFWGVDLRTGKGENRLGNMIMEIRELLKQDKL